MDSHSNPKLNVKHHVQSRHDILLESLEEGGRETERGRFDDGSTYILGRKEARLVIYLIPVITILG